MKRTRVMVHLVGLVWICAHQCRPGVEEGVAMSDMGGILRPTTTQLNKRLMGKARMTPKALSGVHAQRKPAKRYIRTFILHPFCSRVVVAQLFAAHQLQDVFWHQSAGVTGMFLRFSFLVSCAIVVLATLALCFTPITDNAKMGQANLLVLLAGVLGLWLRSGVSVGVAAMAKMSPALYLFGFWHSVDFAPFLRPLAPPLV